MVFAYGNDLVAEASIIPPRSYAHTGSLAAGPSPRCSAASLSSSYSTRAAGPGTAATPGLMGIRGLHRPGDWARVAQDCLRESAAIADRIRTT
jgi:hypothetical protein